MDQLTLITGTLCILLLLTIYIVYNFFNKKYYSETEITIVIFNNKPSQKLGFILNTLKKYRNVAQIIIIHFTKNLSKNYQDPKILSIEDFSEEQKLFKFTKFINKIETEAILFLDNETLFTELFLLKILERYDLDIESIYGTTHCLCDEKGYHTNSLTRNVVHDDIMLTSKKLCKNIMRDFYLQKPLIETCKKEKGDLDDLLFDYFFKTNYNKLPSVVNGKFIHYGKNTKKSKNLKKKRNLFCQQLYK
jgi:hypothetical protein